MVEQSTYGKKKSVIWPSLAGLFLVILLGLFFLPNLLSTDWANNKLMQVVNDRIPGQIDFDALSLSWFDGIQSRDLTYVDRKEGITVNVEEITTSKGLLALAANYKEFGTITVKTPVIQLYLDEKPTTTDTGTTSEATAEVPVKKSQDSTIAQPEKPKETGSPIIMPPLDGNLIVIGGAVKAIFPDTKEKLLLKDLELKAHLAGHENLLDYQTAFLSGDSSGKVKGTGTFTLPSTDSGQLNDIQSEAELDIEKWEIADLLSILAYIADTPSGSGQINGRMNISGSTSTALKLKGNLTGQQIMLQGGPLKSDAPSFDKVVVEVDAEKTAAIITLNQLTLTSALATAAVSGTFDFPDKKEITGKANIDLAQLFAQFPSSLNLKEDTRVSSGRVDLEVKVNTSGKDTYFDGSARLDELQGSAGGKKLVWDESVILEAKGGQSTAGLQLDKLSVQSAFLNGTGQGDFNHMTIQMAADLGAVSREVEKFIELDGMKFDGKMDLNLQVETKAEELRVATADVSIKDFLFQQGKRAIAPRSSFKAKLVTDLRVDKNMQPKEMLDASLDFHSWIGGGVMSLEKMAVPSENGSYKIQGMDLKGVFDLQHLTVLLQTIEALPQDTRLAGMATIHARGALDGNRLQIEDAVVNTDQFLFTQKKKSIKDRQLNLAAKGTILLDERKISLKPLTLQSSSGKINIKELAVADWSDMTKPVQAAISANLDLKRTTGMLADYLPEKWESDGKLALNLDVAPQGKQTFSASGKLLINDFVLKDGKQTLAPKGDVTAKLSALLDMDKGGAVSTVSNSKLNYQSWMSEGEVSIERIRVSNPQKEPEVEGLRYVGTIDISALSGLLRSTDMLPADISLAGKADIDTRLSFKGNRLDLEKTTVDAVDFMFQKDKLKFNEKKIQLTTSGVINLDERSATLKPLDLKAGGDNITLPQLVVKDWNNLSDGVKTSGSIDLDLGLLTARLGDLLKKYPGITVTGRSALKIDADITGGNQQFVRMDGKIGPLKIDVKDKQSVAEDSIRVKADLKGDILGQNFKLHEFELSSAPISLNAAGGITQDKLERVLNAEGSVNLDLKAVSSYLRSLADLEVEMIGDTESPFAIKVRSVDGRWIDLPKHSEFTTSFHADTIRGFGLIIESLEIPVKLTNGLAEIDVQGTVNRGKMALKSSIDFTVDTPAVSVPENSDVLAGVGFSEAMSNDLLAHVHPLFKGAAISEGTMDLSLQHFNWPLDAAKRKDAAFAASITFNEVVLRSGGLLTPLLEVMKANEREVTLGDKPIECIGENDRIRCSPLEIKTRDHTLMLSGSVGFDKTLDYKAQIPVTRKMVSSDMYKYLEGTFISVPIGGTVSSPSLRKDILQTALKDLAIQAGKKQITDQAGKFLQKLFK